MAKIHREPFDDYPTPTNDARYLVGLLPIRPGSLILEPHANRGNIVRAIQAEVPGANIYANELQRKYIRPLQRLVGRHRVRCGDFTTLETRMVFDWTIANPPFTGNTGIAHVEKALTISRNVAMWLPLRYLASARRKPFWDKAPTRHVWPVAERPVFVGNNGGRSDYAWYWWKIGYKGRPTFRVISLIEP